MEVDKDNFDEALQLLESALTTADFVAIDLEMTGIRLDGEEQYRDLPEDRYLQQRSVASSYSIVQVGVSVFEDIICIPTPIVPACFTSVYVHEWVLGGGKGSQTSHYWPPKVCFMFHFLHLQQWVCVRVCCVEIVHMTLETAEDSTCQSGGGDSYTVRPFTFYVFPSSAEDAPDMCSHMSPKVMLDVDAINFMRCHNMDFGRLDTTLVAEQEYLSRVGGIGLDKVYLHCAGSFRSQRT